MIIIIKRQQNYAYPKVINWVNYYFFVPPEHVKWLLTVIISFEKHFFFFLIFHVTYTADTYISSLRTNTICTCFSEEYTTTMYVFFYPYLSRRIFAR